jgi:GrpB-like predicted nucleotidyltransferase (UPF0157 family)
LIVSAEPVVIVDHDARWFEAFDSAAADLRDVLLPWVVEIEHIGSTAVVGLAAKPIIDIQVGVVILGASRRLLPQLKRWGMCTFRSTNAICRIGGTSDVHPPRASRRIMSISSSGLISSGGIDTSGSVTGYERIPTTGIVTQR